MVNIIQNNNGKNIETSEEDKDGYGEDYEDEIPWLDRCSMETGTDVMQDLSGGGTLSISCTGGCITIKKILYSCKARDQSEPTQLKTVKDLCEDKDICEVTATREMFGDEECPDVPDRDMNLWAIYRCNGGEDFTTVTETNNNNNGNNNTNTNTNTNNNGNNGNTNNNNNGNNNNNLNDNNNGNGINNQNNNGNGNNNQNNNNDQNNNNNQNTNINHIRPPVPVPPPQVIVVTVPPPRVITVPAQVVPQPAPGGGVNIIGAMVQGLGGLLNAAGGIRGIRGGGGGGGGGLFGGGGCRRCQGRGGWGGRWAQGE